MSREFDDVQVRSRLIVAWRSGLGSQPDLAFCNRLNGRVPAMVSDATVVGSGCFWQMPVSMLSQNLRILFQDERSSCPCAAFGVSARPATRF
jgi:hypothetical protein